jgi:RND family efflux transporter MFP subunit
MNKIVWVVLAILVLLIGWRLFVHIRDNNSGAGGPQGQQMAVTVETAETQLMTMRDIGSFSGSLKPISGFTIASKISGRLEQLLPDIGDNVNRGEVIAVLDDDVYQQQLEQARASLRVAEAQVEQGRLAFKAAEANWTAQKTLYDKGYSTQAVMDQTDADKAAAEAKYNTVLAEVQKAQASLRTAEIQLSYTRIKAEWSGGGNTRVVGERFAEEGNLLSPNQPILTLLDISTVTAEIDVTESDYAKIKKGMPAGIISDIHPDRTFSGKLTRLAPILREESRLARAEVDIPNPSGSLKPGMFVQVQIEYARHEDALAVPEAAVVKRDGRDGVFLVDESNLSVDLIPISVGITQAGFTEILEPSISGKVVILGQDQLQDGSRINLVNEASAGKDEKTPPEGRS